VALSEIRLCGEGHTKGISIEAPRASQPQGFSGEWEYWTGGRTVGTAIYA